MANDLCGLLLVFGRVICLVAILARIGHLIFEYLDELVKNDGDERANDWTHP